MLRAKIIFFFVLFFSLIPRFENCLAVQYQDSDTQKQLNALVGEKGANLGEPNDPRTVVALLIKQFLGILGILFLVYTVYGGIKILTSGGKEDEINKGKDIIQNGIIGLAIILCAYGIVWLVTSIAYGGLIKTTE